MRPVLFTEVGEVRGKRLLHLQCHIGLDTLSWARRGAVVTGLDFSPAAVAVGGERFDIVYTGFGALCRLPDIAGWARTVAALVVEGGFLYLAEYHPVAELLADDGVTVEGDYFHREPIVVDAPGTYADAAASMDATLTVEWRHGVGEVVSALAAAGLRVEFLHEHDRGHFRLSAGRGVPRVYSVRAVKTGR